MWHVRGRKQTCVVTPLISAISYKFSQVIPYDRNSTIFPALPRIDSADAHIVSQESPIPLQFQEKRRRRQRDANANFSGPPSGKEGERKELDESTSVSIIQHE